MKRFLLGIVAAITCSLILSIGLAVKSHNDLEKMRGQLSWFSEYKPLPNCHVEVGDARLEYKTQDFRDKTFLTADVFAQCDTFQRNAQVTFEIWKQGALFAHRVIRVQNNPTIPKYSGRDIAFTNLGSECKNSIISTYFVVASVSATKSGRRKETPQISSMAFSRLPCGT
jgi:hypothetical protein